MQVCVVLFDSCCVCCACVCVVIVGVGMLGSAAASHRSTGDRTAATMNDVVTVGFGALCGT